MPEITFCISIQLSLKSGSPSALRNQPSASLPFLFLASYASIIASLEGEIKEDDIKQYKLKIYRDYQDKFGNCTLDGIIETHMENLLFIGKSTSLNTQLNKYLSVTLKDVKTFIKKHLTLDKVYMFYSGPHKFTL